MGNSGSSGGAVQDHQDQESLVGVAVGVHQGDHGVMEVVHSGQQAGYTVVNTVRTVCTLMPSFCWICMCWPVSWPVFLIVFMFQYCAPCCFCCLGNRWCFLPSQIGYIHALTVVQHQIKETCLGWLCCLGCMVQIQPGVLTTAVLLPTPPRYMYDEDRDVAHVMTFVEYMVAKKATFPPYSGKYRAIDGGGNHRRHTFLGQGGRGYACNEPFTLPSYQLPDPDEMMRDLQIRVAFHEAPWGLNSFAGWFANLAIHEFFRSATRRDAPGGIEKPWVNLHSGYLDLQTLYGYNQDIHDIPRASVQCFGPVLSTSTCFGI